MTLGLGFAKSMSLGTTFTAYTSPNAGFNTVKELSFKVSQASRFNPYGTLAFELSGQADGGDNKGTYLELGAGPAFPLKANGPTLTIPIKFGFSLSDYYESGGEDHNSASSTSAPRSRSRSRACRAITGHGTSTAAWTSSRSAIPPRRSTTTVHQRSWV